MVRPSSNQPLLARPPSSAPDPRQEQGSLSDYPTDVTLRPSGIRTHLKMRLGHASEGEGAGVGGDGDGPTEQTEIGPSPARLLPTAAIPRDVRAWLDVRSGPTAGQRPVHLTMVRTQIGRGRQADVRIEDRKLSRRHVTIFYTGQEFRIRDEVSGNGTFLNGSRVVEYALRDGDEVVAGGTTFAFHFKRT